MKGTRGIDRTAVAYEPGAVSLDGEELSRQIGGVLGETERQVAVARDVRRGEVEDGETRTTDGPFVAVKEALAGYLFYEADDLDAAIELAARIPPARMGGAVEIHPLKEG